MKDTNKNKASLSHSKINENETAKERKARIERELREERRKRAIKNAREVDMWCAIPKSPSKDRG